MNKTLSLIRFAIVAVLVIVQLPLSAASPYGFILIDGIFYDIVNDHAEVTYKMYDHSYYSGDIVIPEEITYYDTTYPVTTIGTNAFFTGSSASSSVTSVTIPNSVTTIQNDAFNGCCGLTELILPEGVTYIGPRAFSRCSGLTQFSVPDGVTAIPEATFQGCSRLADIHIGNSVATIGRSAFSSCKALTSITIPESVSWIGKWAFEYCYGINTLYYNAISCRDTTWQDAYFNAFTDCPLVNIVFGDHVQHIPAYLAKGQARLKYVTIPNSVTLIGEDAFKESGLMNLALPDSLITIQNSAFENCTGLTKITIPDCVTTIGDNAFKNCVRAEHLDIGNSVTAIGDYAFGSCSGLTNLILSNSVATIGNYAFSGCSQLVRATIGSSVTSIGEIAFQSCSQLTDITCLATTPPSVTDGLFDVMDYYSHAELHVPQESFEAYRTAFHWENFHTIVGDVVPYIETPIDVNGDGEITVADANSVVVIIINGGEGGHSRVPNPEGDGWIYIGDVNIDGEVNIADYNALINFILQH